MECSTLRMEETTLYTQPHRGVYGMSPREILYTAGVPAPENAQPYIDDPIAAAGDEPAEFPDIYYTLQAHILAACDRYEAFSGGPLTKRNLQDLSEALYNEIVRVHPTLMSYDDSVQAVAAIPAQQQFRARNLLRDLIEILLLTEFYRRLRGR